MMCMHILETMNSIVYLAQCVGGGLRWRDWFWDNISMAISQSSHLDLSRCPLLHKSLQPPVLQTERVVI